EGRTPVVWLDGLDIPLVRAFDASWVSALRPARPPAPADDAAQAEFRWPWQSMRRALEQLAASTPKDRLVTRAYVTPTGAPPLTTQPLRGCFLTALRVAACAPAMATQISVDPRVEEEVGRGRSRVLVELRLPGGVRPEGEQRQAIARAQDEVLSRLSGTDFTL